MAAALLKAVWWDLHLASLLTHLLLFCLVELFLDLFTGLMSYLQMVHGTFYSVCLAQESKSDIIELCLNSCAV